MTSELILYFMKKKNLYNVSNQYQSEVLKRLDFKQKIYRQKVNFLLKRSSYICDLKNLYAKIANSTCVFRT